MDYNPIDHTRITLQYLRNQTDSVILFYSGGKDSVVLLDLLSKMNFKRIVCCFMYLIKDLEHQQPYLKWIQTYKNTELVQYPHWVLSWYKADAYYMFHTEANKSAKKIQLQDIYRKVKKDTGIQWIVNGAKRADSFNRMIWLGNLKFNAISKGNVVYPLSYWRKKDVKSYINGHNLIRSIDYGNNTRASGFDIDLKTLLFMREKYPEDLQKTLKVFPFAGIILTEYDHGNNKTSEIRDGNDTEKHHQECPLQPQED